MEIVNASPSTQRPVARSPLREIRVLLVEDDPDTAEMVEAMLARAGALVVSAHSGAGAVLELERRGFDVVVTDYALGRGLTGFELLAHIRAQPVDAHIPVIGYSAHAGMVPPHEQAAFTAYAAKPLFIDNVLGLVRGVVPRRGRRGDQGN